MEMLLAVFLVMFTAIIVGIVFASRESFVKHALDRTTLSLYAKNILAQDTNDETSLRINRQVLNDKNTRLDTLEQQLVDVTFPDIITKTISVTEFKTRLATLDSSMLYKLAKNNYDISRKNNYNTLQTIDNDDSVVFATSLLLMATIDTSSNSYDYSCADTNSYSDGGGYSSDSSSGGDCGGSD